MYKPLLALALFTTCLVAPAAAESPKVQVKLVADLSQYIDIGDGPSDRERNARDLEQVFQGLAAELPAGQTLSVEVLDVNLAGELEWLRNGQRIRVMRDIGWPQIEVRYVLRQGDTVVKEGQARVSDMAYLGQARWAQAHSPLGFERAMLVRWIKATLATS